MYILQPFIEKTVQFALFCIPRNPVMVCLNLVFVKNDWTNLNCSKPLRTSLSFSRA